PSAVGGSFYGPLLPPGSVHVATCFNSIQWLDQVPAGPNPDFVAYPRPHPSRPRDAVPSHVTAAYRPPPEPHLLRCLERRARDRVRGGQLLLASAGDTEEACVGDGLGDVLNDACLDLVADGRMSREEYERLTFPAYFRTVSELLEPLERDASPVCG